MDDARKQSLLMAFVAFNLAVIAYQIIWNSNPFSMARLGLGLVLGLTIGAITFGVTRLLESR